MGEVPHIGEHHRQFAVLATKTHVGAVALDLFQHRWMHIMAERTTDFALFAVGGQESERDCDNPDDNAAAKREGVEIRLYSIIYELIENVESAMKGLLEPELREQVIGEAEIREVFELSKKSKIAGCMVMSGRITSKASIRIKRGSDILFEGLIGSLKRFQKNTMEKFWRR